MNIWSVFSNRIHLILKDLITMLKMWDPVVG